MNTRAQLYLVSNCWTIYVFVSALPHLQLWLATLWPTCSIFYINNLLDSSLNLLLPWRWRHFFQSLSTPTWCHNVQDRNVMVITFFNYKIATFSGLNFALSVALYFVAFLCLFFLSSLVPLHLFLITSVFARFSFIFASLSASLIPPPRFYFSLLLLLSLFLLSSPVFFIYLVPLRSSLIFLFSCFPLLSSRRYLPVVNDITLQTYVRNLKPICIPG